MKASCRIFKMSKTFDREADTFPFTEFEWAQMMLLSFERWEEMPEYEVEQPQHDAIYTIMHKEPTTLQEAHDTIRRKELRIEQLEKRVEELEKELEM